MKRIIFTLFLVGWATFLKAGSPDSNTVNALIIKAIEYESNADFEATFQTAKKAFILSEKLQYLKGTASACMRLGSVYNLKGKNDSALFYLQKAYTIRKHRQDYKGATKCCFSLCNVYKQTGKTDLAFQVLFDALKLNKFTRDNADLAEIYIELGNLNAEYGDLKSALNYLLKGEQLSKQNDDVPNLLNAYSGLGNYYFTNNNFKAALGYYFKADTLNSELNNRVALCMNYNNIAICYDQLKDVKNASIFYHKAIAESIVLELRNEEANACYNLGSMFNNLRIPDSAMVYLNRSLAIASETHNAQRIADCYEYLSDAFALKGNFSKALQFHKYASALNDSLLNSEKISRIAEMQTKYETEKKEQKITLLDQQNRNKAMQRNAFIAGFAGLLVVSLVVMRQRNRIKREKRRSDALLLNILPADVAEELKHTGTSVAKQYNHVTVMFTDFVDFTGISQKLTPIELVNEINNNFTKFDAIIEQNGLEKIKTIGDAYMAVCGLPKECDDHAQKAVKAALQIQEVVNRGNGKFKVRIGIHSGSVVAGIVGVKKYAYDVWGDTVNTASRMESYSEPGKINISAATFELVKDDFNLNYRGKFEVKGKGEMDLYFVEGII